MQIVFSQENHMLQVNYSFLLALALAEFHILVSNQLCASLDHNFACIFHLYSLPLNQNLCTQENKISVPQTGGLKGKG